MGGIGGSFSRKTPPPYPSPRLTKSRNTKKAKVRGILLSKQSSNSATGEDKYQRGVIARAQALARRKERCRKDPAFRKRFNRQKALRDNYGLSLNDYEALQIAQKNKCGICGVEPMPDDKALAVDCDHTNHPPFVRGLLCMKCNTSIGKFNHDVRLLQRAIDWLNGVR